MTKVTRGDILHAVASWIMGMLMGLRPLPPAPFGDGPVEHCAAARSSGRPPGLDGLRFFDDTATWFEKEWMPLVRIGPLQQATEPSHGST